MSAQCYFELWFKLMFKVPINFLNWKLTKKQQPK